MIWIELEDTRVSAIEGARKSAAAQDPSLSEPEVNEHNHQTIDVADHLLIGVVRRSNESAKSPLAALTEFARLSLSLSPSLALDSSHTHANNN